MPQSDRTYECIVFGATGYTGKYAAEHIVSTFPTDFKWAIAGRSEEKLRALATELKSLNPGRASPDIEVSSLFKGDLIKLAKKTKVLISTVGPYHKYGTNALEACTLTGTHYLDCTGEVPWVHQMAKTYHEGAKKSGAILIPQNGVESAPPDLLCWLLVSHIRRVLGTGTAELIQTMHEIKATASGGTLATILTLFDTYSVFYVLKTMKPWSMSTVTPPVQPSSRSWSESFLGARHDPDLGILTDGLAAATDTVQVNRSWSLFDDGKFYGPKFQLNAYMTARSSVSAFFWHLALGLGALTLLIPPVRWLLRRFVTQPGQGTPKERAAKERVEWRAVAKADVTDPHDPKRAFGRLRWNGSMYSLTGTCLAEAALVLAREKTVAHQIGGGLLTPATLGGPFVERLQKAGMEIEVKTMP